MKEAIGYRVTCDECGDAVDVIAGERKNCSCPGVTWSCEAAAAGITLKREPGGIITGPWKARRWIEAIP